MNVRPLRVLIFNEANFYDELWEHREDLTRMLRILKANGYKASFEALYRAWLHYSDTHYGGEVKYAPLAKHDDERIFRALLSEGNLRETSQ